MARDDSRGAGQAVGDGDAVAADKQHFPDTIQTGAAPAWVRPPRQILTPQDHAEILHGSGRGRVTIAQRTNGRWKEHSIAVADIGYVAGQLVGASDCYLSQNRFRTYRRAIANLAQLAALFADLDYYALAPGIAHLTPHAVLRFAYECLDEFRIPPPTVAISTGRGVALIWLHSPVPRAALNRWQRCQRTIHAALADIGADPRALDAARVLRLVGTKNPKSKTIVMPLTDVGPTWPFDSLADEILPVNREELERLRAQRAKVNQQKRRPQTSQLQGFKAMTLAEGRLTDLQKLLHYRWFGALPPGHRDEWMFLAGANMAYLVRPDLLFRELVTLAAEVASWTEGETKSRLSAVQNRTKLAALGQRIAYGGKLVDPRYRFRTATIIKRLGITEAEMIGAHLRHLVSDDILRERERERGERRRRKNGAIDRKIYLTNALSNTRPWDVDGISRRTWERRRTAQNGGGAGRVASPSGCMVAEPPPPGGFKGLRASREPKQLLGGRKSEALLAVMQRQPRQLELPLSISLPRPDQAELDSWHHGIIPQTIRGVLVRELRARDLRHRELATVVAVSRPQLTNVLRGRFGISPGSVRVLKNIITAWGLAA